MWVFYFYRGIILMKTIKQIIREEIDNSFDWVRDIKPMGTIHDLIKGDFVIPTCTKPEIFLVEDIFSSGLISPKGDYELQRKVQLRRYDSNGNQLDSGVILYSFTDIGDNCRFEFVGSDYKLDKKN